MDLVVVCFISSGLSSPSTGGRCGCRCVHLLGGVTTVVLLNIGHKCSAGS